MEKNRMSLRVLLGLFFIFVGVAIGIGYTMYKDDNGLLLVDEEEEVVTLTERMKEGSFVLENDYYLREVVQNEIDFTEILESENDKFIRITENDYEKEVFTYDYGEDEFVYLYYYADELVMYFSYDYETEVVISDEDELLELLTTDIEDLKVYFNSVLADILKEEL